MTKCVYSTIRALSQICLALVLSLCGGLRCRTRDEPKPTPDSDPSASRVLGPNPSAHKTQELVWAVYRAKPWDASYKEVTKIWKAIASELQDWGMFIEKDGHYIRRRTLALLDIHHNPKKDYKFFVTEEQRVCLEGALEKISSDWDKSEEKKRTRTEGKRKAEEKQENEGEILRKAALRPLLRTGKKQKRSLDEDTISEEVKTLKDSVRRIERIVEAIMEKQDSEKN